LFKKTIDGCVIAKRRPNLAAEKPVELGRKHTKKGP
jgi:hypothetical protein